jgi:hypothetical protein
MSFVLNNMIFDRTVGATVSEKGKGKVKAWLSQLSNISFNTSADPIEIADALGNIVYRKYNAKNLEISATNAFISTDVIALTSGTDMVYATDVAPLRFPKIEEVKVGTETLEVKGFVEGTMEIYGLTASGAMSTEVFGLAAADTDHQFSIADGVLTLPTYTDDNIVKFLVKYTRDVTSGMKAVNYGDKFSKTSELVFKCLAVDPCDQKLRACYIVVPSASISPDVELAIANGESNTIDFSAQALLDVCAEDKTLFYIAFAEEDEEE